MFTLKRTVQVSVVPYAARARMFSKIDRSCEHAKKHFPTSYRDPYKLEVEIFALKDLEYFNEAIEQAILLHPHRRFLDLMELLTFNLQHESIRSIYPIFTSEYVLEYEPIDCVDDPDSNDNIWALSPASFYRGQVVNPGACFATTPYTPLDVVDRNDLDALGRLLSRDMAELKPKIPRLTA